MTDYIVHTIRSDVVNMTDYTAHTIRSDVVNLL